MKKHVLILALTLLTIPLIVSAQTRRMWNFVDTVNWSHDSIYYPDQDGDISSFPWTATVVTENLSAPITIGIGGSNYPLDAVGIRYAYTDHGVDSLPYTFDPTAVYHQMIMQDDTVTGVTFHSGSDPFGFERPQLKLQTTTDTTFTLKVYMTFSK